MKIKLRANKSQMYDLVKDHAGDMNPNIKTEEFSKLRDTEFKKSLSGLFYQLEFSASHK